MRAKKNKGPLKHNICTVKVDPMTQEQKELEKDQTCGQRRVQCKQAKNPTTKYSACLC